MGLGKWIKKGAVSFALATGGAERNTLNQVSEETGNGSTTSRVIPVGQNQLMRDLKEGNVTQQVQEFRQQYYQILQASEKYKFKWGKDGDFSVLTEEEVARNKSIKGDPYDNYKVEVLIDNIPKTDSMFGGNLVYPVKVVRHTNHNVKIEEYAHQVHIRDIDGTRKLIDFYISIGNPENRVAVLEARHLKESPSITGFNNITQISFTTPGSDMLSFEYKVLAFDKVVEYNGDYIVKMFAEVTKNGEWLAERYMLKD